MTPTDRPVLLAYDGSPSAATAITIAGQLVRRRRAIVCTAWARPSAPIFHTDPGRLPGALRDAAEEFDQLELEAAEQTAADGVRLAESAGFQAEPLCVAADGQTWRALLDGAQAVHASMLVAGAQGMSGLKRALLGSVSTGLVHHAHLPLLVVPGTASIVRADGPMLLCYDRSDLSARAIAAAAELLSPEEALVLHVWESWVAHAPALAGTSGTVLGMAAELDEIADEQSTDLAARGVQTAERAGLDARPLSGSATGPVWRTILDHADEQTASVIALGSRGLGGLSAALGSVSSGVLHHSRRPVFVVPPEAASSARNGAET